MATDDTRTRLLDAAGPIFGEKGYLASTVREICQAANVNVASVNYYFGDKERLYIETVKRAHEMKVAPAPMPQWPAETPGADRLTDFIRTLVTRMLEIKTPAWQTKLIIREIQQPTSACKELVESYIRPHFELLQSILCDLLPADTPRHRRRQIGFSIIGQCMHYCVAGEVVAMLVDPDEYAEHFTPRAIAEHIARFSLAALGQHPPLGRTTDAADAEAPQTTTDHPLGTSRQ